MYHVGKQLKSGEYPVYDADGKLVDTSKTPAKAKALARIRNFSWGMRRKRRR